MEKNTFAEINAAKLLLEGSSMVTIRCIEIFNKARIRTLAHMHEDVLSDYKTFKGALTDMQRAAGDQWKFYRILMPTDTSLAVSRFPTLARVSVAYCKHHIDSGETYRQIKDPRFSCDSELLEFVKHRLPNNYVNVDNRGEILPEDLKILLSDFGINPNTWVHPRVIFENMMNRLPNNNNQMADALQAFMAARGQPQQN